MNPSRIAVGLIGFGIVACLPCIAIGSSLVGRQGFLVGLIGLMVLMLGIAVLSERILVKYYGASADLPGGLRRSLEMALSDSGKKIPRVYIYSDPLPSALAARALGNSGAILISQGLISLLNEGELREVIRLCQKRLGESSLVLQSFCLICALGVSSLVPKQWRQWVFDENLGFKSEVNSERDLNPLSMVRFLVLYPFIQFLILIGSRARSASVCLNRNHLPESSYASILQKLGSLGPVMKDCLDDCWSAASLDIVYQGVLRRKPSST